MKIILVLALCLAMLFLLCACGESYTISPVATAAPAASEETDPAPTAQTGAAEQATDSASASEAALFSPDFFFSTVDRDGNVWDESVFAEHKLTMINFWEPWCGPCVREMPDLQALYEAYADQGLLILGVYSTSGMEQDVDAVLASTGVQYPILNSCDSFSIFETGYVPTTVFVDQQGHVYRHILSDYERSGLADVIRALGEERVSALYIGSASYDGWAGIIEELLCREG